MISANKTIACLLTMFILTVSVCVCADSSKAVSQEKPKYELKSDIINFDYTKLSYPAWNTSLGINNNTANMLKERKPGKVESDEETVKFGDDELIEGLKMVASFILVVLICIAMFSIVPLFIGFGVIYPSKSTKDG